MPYKLGVIIVLTFVVSFWAIGVSATQLTDGLVGYWALNGNGNDESGNGYDANLANRAKWVDSAWMNGAVEVDGIGGHVVVDRSFRLTTDRITVSARINGRKTIASTGIITGRSRTPFSMVITETNILTYVWNNNSVKTWGWRGGPEIPQDEWALVAIAIEPSKATAYVYHEASGKLNANVNNIPHIEQSVTNLKFGWDECCGDGRYFKGLIDEVMIYDRTLDAHEIKRIATVGLPIESSGELTTTRTGLNPTIGISPAISISPASGPSPAIGEQLRLSLNIVGGENVAGYQASVGFNARAFRYVESANGDYLPPGAFFGTPTVERDRVTLGAISSTGAVNGDGTLATLTFEVLDVRDSTLALSEVILIKSDGSEYSPLFSTGGRVIQPTLSSPAIVSVIPSRVLSPAIRQQLVFGVGIAGGTNVVDHQLTWEYDKTALKCISISWGNYIVNGVGNGDGGLLTGTFEVLSVKDSTVNVSGHLIRQDGFRYIPTFESAQVIAPLSGDVNRDGFVNVLDLVMVTLSFGQRVQVEGNPADVNEDGIVSIVDLVRVAGEMGAGAAAPAAHPQTLQTLTAANVQDWLRQAQHANLTDATSQRGILMLQQILAALIPKETSLLANYPNPFNPETWIPYQLSEAADVSVSIYSVEGKLVRTLALGHQTAGIYQGKSRAAYWDGRNESGESVASGVYFYTLTAGNFTATRKMLILK